MRKKGLLCACILLALLLTGCAKEGQEAFQLRLFYPAAEFKAGGDVLHSQAVDWSKEDSKDTAEQVEKVKASMSQDWRKDPVPFPSYLLTNNNANIRRVRQRIEELSHKAEFVGWTFPGGEAKVNEAENRLQLIFEEKPDADTRQALKSEGFKWAPSQGAWQRQLNQNAIRAAARLDFLRPEDGKSPYQLQPFAKRAEKDVSR